MFTDIGSVQIELFEIGDTQTGAAAPNLAINSVQCLGSIYSYNTLRFNVEYRDPDKIYSAPTLIKGLGPSLGNGFISNPQLEYSFNAVTGLNNDWTGSQSGLINTTTYAPTSGVESAVFTGINNGTNYVYLKQTGSPLYDYKKGRIDIIAINGSLNTGFNEPRTIISGQSSGWASYDISTGVNNKKVFAYSISILDKISGVSGVSGFDISTMGGSGGSAGGANIRFNYPIINHSGLTVIYTGEIRQGYCSTSSLFMGESGSCVVPQSFLERINDEDPSEVCLPSGLSSGSLRTAIAEFIQNQILINSSVGEIIAGEDPSTAFENTASNYTVYNGYIYLDNPYSGDAITFNSYNLDPNYSGLYYNTYGFYPPYPETGVTFTYPTDFTTASGLTTLINNNLNSGNFNLWYPDLDDYSNNPSGYFETGALLRATYIDSGTIRIESRRIGSAGKYRFSVASGLRPQQKTPFNILKFMLPDRVSLQGANVFGTWTNLHSVTGLSWGKLTPTTITKQFVESVTGISGATTTPAAQTTVESITGAPYRQLVYTTTISGRTKCGSPYSENVNFYTINTGLGDSCTDSVNDQLIDGLNSILPVTTTTGSQMGNHYFLKTGWSFNNNTEYNYYRVVMSDFKADTRNINQGVIDEFYLSNIALFGYESGVVLQTGDMSILGATYSGRIQGVTTGVITGTVSGYANSGTTGRYPFINTFVTGIPNGNNIVRFQNLSGVATTPFTGLLNIILTGTGFYTENVGGYFYESGVTGISFVKPVSGLISGSGQLTGGPYNIITNLSVVTGTQTVTGESSGIASGVIPDFTYPFTNIAAFSYASGTITGAPTSGYFTVSSGISISPSIAYQFDVTGYLPASAILTYNSPAFGDTVFINNTPIIYATGTVLEPPSYFRNITELKNIINSGSGNFLVTGSVNGATIVLGATSLGVTGNSIPLSSTGAAGKPTFSYSTTTGGITYYRPITPTGIYTGALAQTAGSTGFYSRTGIGNITGLIKNLDFVRYFTGIWDLTTGDSDFRDNLWISGFSYNNFPFITTGTFISNPSNIDLSVSYLNDPPVITTDLAILTVTGFNFGTGISIIISGAL